MSINPERAFLLLLVGACRAEPPPTARPDPPPPLVARAPPVAAPPTSPRYAASWILVSWEGAIDAPKSGRTREMAREAAEDARRSVARGTPFAEVARQVSDDPSAGRGGTLGVYQVGTMVPDFEAAVAAVEVGAMTPVFETPFGWAFARRDAVIEARFSHIQVGHAGAWRSAATRTTDEARDLAASVRAEIVAGLPFAQAAARFSEDPSTAAEGGDLGLVAPGQLVPAFEDAAFALKPGEISEPVASPYGWHLILRTP